MERSGEDELRARQACGEGRRCPGWLVGEDERTGRRRVAAGRSGVWRAGVGAQGATGFVPPIRSGSGRRGGERVGGGGVADRLGFQSGWGLRGGRLGQVGQPGR